MFRILDFERTRKPFTKCDDIIGYIRKTHFEKYEKNINAYTSLKDKIDTAIDHADWLMKQNQNDLDRGAKINDLSAYTDVHILVQKLIKPGKIN